MPLVEVIPLNVAIGLLVLSAIGTLTGLWITVALLRRSELRQLGNLLGSPQSSAPGDDPEHFGLPGSEDAARGLLRYAVRRSGAGFALLFLPSHGTDCMTVTAVEGDAAPWADAEIALYHPIIKRMEAAGAPEQLVTAGADVPLPAYTMLFPIRSRGHLIGLAAVGPRGSHRPIGRRSQQSISALAKESAVPIENAQLYGSLRRAFSDLESAQRALLALQRVSVEAQSSLRLEHVLPQIADGMVDDLPFDAAVIFLTDTQRRTIAMAVAAGTLSERQMPAEEIAFEESNPADQALLANEVLVTHDPRESVLPRLLLAAGANPNEVSFEATIIGLPLSSNGSVIGGMTLTTQRAAIPSSEIESLKSFAAEAAATIQNARLYGQLEQAFAELRTTQDQLIRAERLRTLGQVASGVAHDFNNILAAVITRAQLAALQTRSAPMLDHLRVIEQAAMDGASAARRIQGLARPQDDQIAEVLDVNDLVREALELTRPMWSNQARARGVSIRAETSYTPNVLVEGLPGELREVFTNLVLNATAAMPAGGTLAIRTERLGDEVWCTVEDTGTGMSEEVRSHVFDPFFTTKGEAGSGLGMSIVAAILLRHQGRIEIESKVGLGTTVRFALPASHGIARRLAPKRRRGKVSLRLLLAEGDAPTRDALSMILTKNGHRVAPAAGAEEAMHLLAEQEFDVVITDLGLGEHSGWEVAAASKVLRPSAAVILASAWGADWDASEARERGVDGILSKPFTVDDVLESLEKALLQSG